MEQRSSHGVPLEAPHARQGENEDRSLFCACYIGMFGTVNAHRGYSETGCTDFARAEIMWPGWLSQLLSHPIGGLENCEEIFRALLEARDAIKVYAIVDGK